MDKALAHNTAAPAASIEQPGRLRNGANRLMSRIGIAALCVIPVADLALSDAVFAKAYETTSQKVHLESKPLETLAVDGIMGVAIAGESVALGFAISRARKLQGAFNDYDAYVEDRHAEMSAPRRALSKAAGLPFKALEKIGSGFEKIGEFMANRHSKTARQIGKLAVDAGQVNAMGTSTVILQETLAGDPPTTGRNVKLGALIAASWIGGAEVIKGIYHAVPFAKPPLELFNKGFEKVTDLDVVHPWQTPVASLVLGGIAAGLSVSGWRLARYHETQQEQTAEIEAAQPQLSGALPSEI